MSTPKNPKVKTQEKFKPWGGGFQTVNIGSVDTFPKPQIYKPFKGKGKGKSKSKRTFKPRQAQQLNTFQQLQEKPPGLKSYEAVNSDIIEPGYHWGIPMNEIKSSFNIYAIERDIEKTINGIDQVIEQGWEKVVNIWMDVFGHFLTVWTCPAGISFTFIFT